MSGINSLTPSITYKIASFLDKSAHIKWSKTCKQFYYFFSRSEYFKDLFLRRHPLLANEVNVSKNPEKPEIKKVHEVVFKEIERLFPTTFWKELYECNGNVNKLSPFFFMQSIAPFKTKLQELQTDLKRVQNENWRKDEDNHLIHQALNNLKMSHDALRADPRYASINGLTDNVFKIYHQLSEELEPLYGENVFLQIQKKLWEEEQLGISNKNTLKKIDPGVAFILCYRAYEELNNENQEFEHKSSLMDLNVKNISLHKAGKVGRSLLRDVLDVVTDQEIEIDDQSKLIRAIDLLSKTENDSLEVLEQIRETINSCSRATSQETWLNLYHRHSKNIIPDVSAQDCFQIFLPQLKWILEERVLFSNAHNLGAFNDFDGKVNRSIMRLFGY
jgi:hypothetical protein